MVVWVECGKVVVKCVLAHIMHDRAWRVKRAVFFVVVDEVFKDFSKHLRVDGDFDVAWA